MDTLSSSNLTVHSPDTPCMHCGLPTGNYPVGDGPYFCCTGCEMVYDALRNAGFGDTYYKLQGLSVKRKKPARVDENALLLAELDTASFLEEHTKAIGEQTRSIELFLDGVHCAACVWLIERMPFELEGVQQAKLDLPRARLYLEFTPGNVTLSKVARWLAQFGYIVYPIHQDRASHRSRIEQALLIKAGICWALAGNVMLFAFALYSGLSIEKDDTLLAGARWASFVLAFVATVYGGSEFFKRAWASMKVAWRARDLKRLHIDTPISLGILVGFGHSGWSTITGTGEVWFDSITVLIAALLTARWLQLRSRRIAGDASDQLLSMIPTMARRVNEVEGNHTLVRVDSLHKRDLIEVPAGEVFPVDGQIIHGESSVNNAVLTGESKPEPAKPGQLIQAGATNISSPVFIEVRATGENTRVGKLLSWIQNQQKNSAQVVLLADKLSSYFVLGLLALGILTALLWLHIAPNQAAPHVVALLVISCPCALGMATPLAMAIASGRAARKGIFIKSEEAIQQLTEVDTIVLDKTGTITNGSMTLIEYTGDEEAFQLALQLESYSNHPIAKALLRSTSFCFPDTQNTATDIESIPGQGIQGYIQGHKVAVGRPAWIYSFSAPNKQVQTDLEAYTQAGYTPVAIAMDGQLITGIALGDEVRQEAQPIIEAFKAEGKDIYILSGDHNSVVQHVAHQLHIPSENAIGDASPEDKQAFIEYLQFEKGKTVAMIGDGVNDAAALKIAQVGIAVEGGASPSLVAADVFMTRDGLLPIASLMNGSQKVMSVIKRNLGLSLTYNLIGATAAILGLVTPLVAAIAMPVSSIFVIVSSILQRSFVGESSPKSEDRSPKYHINTFALHPSDTGLSTPDSLSS